MNSLQRLHNLLAGKPIDRIPNFDIFMARAVRHIGTPLSNYYLDYRVLCPSQPRGAQGFRPRHRADDLRSIP
ncbi:hypothetical protein [Candidatus Villigracilis saccharophilus]|uniref:hypothetical protein n=1 Tax=Candidatus Villigracilis saccharophilus TaxID=3140684 RepID=UPI003136D04F|nr:hypothetical protein [Anaerolineales bacterium]